MLDRSPHRSVSNFRDRVGGGSVNIAVRHREHAGVTKPKRVLFVCEGNVHRGPTAEWLYSITPGIQVRSAGLATSARVQVTEALLTWANSVFIMERRLVTLLRRRFEPLLTDKELVCLDVPDDFQFRQSELVVILVERLTPYLGQPSPIDCDTEDSNK